MEGEVRLVNAINDGKQKKNVREGNIRWEMWNDAMSRTRLKLSIFPGSLGYVMRRYINIYFVGYLLILYHSSSCQ